MSESKAPDLREERDPRRTIAAFCLAAAIIAIVMLVFGLVNTNLQKKLDDATKTARAKEAELNKTIADLSEREEELNTRETALETRENELAERESELEEREASLLEAEITLEGKEAELAVREASIDEKYARVLELANELVEELDPNSDLNSLIVEDLTEEDMAALEAANTGE